MLNYPSKIAPQRNWDELYQALCKFNSEHGHCRVPLKGGDTGLGLWVSKLKNNKDTLTEEKIIRLNFLNFEWETRQEACDRIWLKRFEELEDYQKKYWSLRVNYKTHKKLASWANHQKRFQAIGALRKDREELLDKIGFEWKSPDEIQEMKERNQQPNAKSNDAWYKQYKKLEQFKEEHGHCIVPFNYSQDKSLGMWVRTQRTKHKLNDLPEDRFIELKNLGFVFSVDTGDANASINQRKWLERYELLKMYKSTFGTVDIPRTAVYNDINLGSWLRNQKVDAGKGNIDNRRRELLQKIGVTFQDRKEWPWNKQFDKLSEYYKSNGHCDLPLNYENQSLLQWMNKQSNLAALGELTTKKKEKLDSINFNFIYGLADTFVEKIPNRKRRNRVSATKGDDDSDSDDDSEGNLKTSPTQETDQPSWLRDMLQQAATSIQTELKRGQEQGRMLQDAARRLQEATANKSVACAKPHPEIKEHPTKAPKKQKKKEEEG